MSDASLQKLPNICRKILPLMIAFGVILSGTSELDVKARNNMKNDKYKRSMRGKHEQLP